MSRFGRTWRDVANARLGDRVKRRVALVAAAVICAASGSSAYLKLGTEVGSTVVPLRWQAMPIRYYVRNLDVPGVSATQLQTAVATAFATWGAVPNVVISSSFAGFTDIAPAADDNVSVIGFQSRPDLNHTLAATTFTVDTVTGQLLDADILLNSTFNWSVAPAGEANKYDAQSIALHEIGHFLGLNHSALGETSLAADGTRTVVGKGAVMFPIAFPPGNVLDRVLDQDDIAGISDIYGEPAFTQQFGSVAGRVTLNGAGVFGAHVTAFNPTTGTLTGTFTLTPDGDFVVAGLVPGLYVLRAEPLDDADVSSFFSANTVVNVDFRPAFSSQLVSVPAGGSASPVTIEVPAK